MHVDGYGYVLDIRNMVFSSCRRLDSNKIQYLPTGIFANQRWMFLLNMSRNGIQRLSPGIFHKRLILYILDLEANEIQQLQAGALANLRTLVYLNLAENKIKDIAPGVLKSSLLHLFLQKNLLSAISNTTFSNLVNLHYLLLNENRLQVIPDQAFKNMKRLRIIMLSDNSIKTIGLQAFTISSGNLLISMDEGKIGTLKFMDADQTERCRIHLGLGQDNSDYIKIYFGIGDLIENVLLKAFSQAGFAKRDQDENKLLPCPTGTYLNSSVTDSSKLKCLECPAGGFYSDTKAFVHDSCLKCPNGTFIPYNKAPGVRARDCIACPQGTDTNAFAGYRACKCLQGFYRTHRFEGCKPCDQDGFKCENDYVTLKTGYWWKWKNETYKILYENFTMNLINITYSPVQSINSAIISRSLQEFPYTLPNPHKCPREDSCMGGLDSLCDVGYEGPLCEVCSTGYYKQLQSCKLCPTKKWMIFQLSILAAVVVIVVAVLVWTGKKKSKKKEGRSSVDIILGRLKIIIGFYQVTYGVLEAFSYIKWPDSLALIGKYSELLQLSVFQIAPIHCLFSNLKINAFGSLFAILAMNAGAIFLSFLVYGLRKLFLLRSTLSEEQKEKKAAKTKELIYRNLFFFLYVTYLSTCSKTANVLPLACRTLCLDDKEEMCHIYLKADYNIKCQGPKYNRLVSVAYCAVLYIIFLPTASLIALWRQRKALRRNESQDENEALEYQDPGTELNTGLRFLFENYNSHSWYWELIETVRKVVLTSGLILVGGESRAYVGLACVMSGLYGMFFAYISPIVDPFENKLMLTSLAVTFVNLGIGAVSKIPKESIPASIDPYVDNIMFKILVFGANSLVIGLLVVQYFAYIYRYIKEWRKNPQWSFSCCLAMVLPLTDLQGEIRGLAGRNVLKQQLQTGKANMPSVSGSFKDSGAVTFGLKEDETDLMTKARKRNKMNYGMREENEELICSVSLADGNNLTHELPRQVDNTTL
ncbi:uncharacterized protein LOC144650882 isoform X2 [Oculina patagonica]